MIDKPIYCKRCNKEMEDGDWWCEDEICTDCRTDDEIFCERCGKVMEDEDWYQDEPVCFGCYEIQADMIYDQLKEEGYELNKRDS